MQKPLLTFASVIALAYSTTAYSQSTDPIVCPGGATDCNWDEISEDDDERASLPKTAEPELEGSIIEELLGERAKLTPVPGGEFILASIRGFPETKTEMVMRCVKLFGRKMCTKFPKIYRRSSHLEIIGQVQTPRWEKIKGDIQVCAKGAITAGVAAGAVTGAIPAAAAAFEGYMKTCLASKSKKYLKDLKIGLYTRKTPGPWEGT